MKVTRLYPSQAAAGQKNDVIQVEMTPAQARALERFLNGGPLQWTAEAKASAYLLGQALSKSGAELEDVT